MPFSHISGSTRNTGISLAQCWLFDGTVCVGGLETQRNVQQGEEWTVHPSFPRLC